MSMSINSGLDDEWVLNSHADTDLYSLGGSSIGSSDARQVDPMQWLIDTISTECSCQIGFSPNFIFNPFDFSLTEYACTCKLAAKRADKPSKPEPKSKKATPAVTVKKEAPLPEIDPMASIALINSQISPYLVHMEKEYFGDSEASRKLHVPAVGKSDYGKRFGNTVSQHQLDSASDKLDKKLMSATMPASFASQDKTLKFAVSDEESRREGEQGPMQGQPEGNGPRLFHAFKNTELAREPYSYRQDGIIGISGGNYPFDRRPMSASAEASAASYAATGARRKEKTVEPRRKKKSSALHSSEGAQYLEKLHPNRHLEKGGKATRSSSTRADAGSSSRDNDDFFMMTSTNEAEPVEEEPYADVSDDENVMFIPSKKPKAARGVVRDEWYFKPSSTGGLFDDIKKKKEEDRIRHVLQKKLEAGEALPLPSQSQSPSVFAAVALSPKGTMLSRSFDDGDGFTATIVDPPGSAKLLAGSIFDPFSETRKSLQKSRSFILDRQRERVRNTEEYEAFFLDDELNLHGEEIAADEVDVPGAQDPLYLISRAEDALATSQKAQGSGGYNAIIRGSEIRSLVAFSAINPEMWVTARVAYLLLVLYHDVVVKVKQQQQVEVDSPDRFIDRVVQDVASKAARPSILGDIKAALQSRKKLGALLAPLTEESSSPSDAVSPFSPQKSSKGASKSIGSELSSASGPVKVDKKDTKKTEKPKTSPNKDKDKDKKASGSDAKVKAGHGHKQAVEVKQPPKPQIVISDEEYIAMLTQKTNMEDFWGKLDEQRVNEGLWDANVALQQFSWPLLQKLLTMHTHVALTLYTIEFGTALDNVVDGDDDSVGSKTGRKLNSFEEKQAQEARNRFFVQFPRGLLHVLRKAVQRNVFRPECVAHTSVPCAKICAWARRIVACIYRAKSKESTLSVPLPSPSRGGGALPKKQLPPIQFPLALTTHISKQQQQQTQRSNNASRGGSRGESRPKTNVLDLVNYTSVGRPPTMDGRAPSLTIVAVGFDIFAHPISANNVSGKRAACLPLSEQFVLDDVLIVGMILSRPFDRLDVLIPSPPESLIQQHMLIGRSHSPEHEDPTHLLQLVGRLTSQQLKHQQQQQQQHEEDDKNWARYEALSHFCKAHIECESNSPSHRILPAALAFDLDVAMDEIVEDGIEHHAQFVNPSKLHAISVSLQTLRAGPRNAEADGLLHEKKTKVSRVDIINKFNSFNRLHEHRVHLQRYGDRQVFGATDVFNYAARHDVQAQLLVVGFPSGSGAQAAAASEAPRAARLDATAEMLESIIRKRVRSVALVVASAGIARTPVFTIPDQPQIHATQSITDILDKRGPSRFVVAVADTPSSQAAFKLALSLCKPCDLIFLVHVVVVVGHLGEAPIYGNSAVHGFSSDSETKAARLVEKYRKLGYNLHVEKAVISSASQIDSLSSVDMTNGLPKKKTFYEDRVKEKRMKLAEALLKCAMNFDPTFLVLGADNADLALAMEVLRDRSLAEIQSLKAREQRTYRLRTGRSLLGGVVSGGNLEDMDEDADAEADIAFENEIEILASLCDHSIASSSPDDSLAQMQGVVKTDKVLTEQAHTRSFAETVLAMGSDPSKRAGAGKGGIGKCCENFSFIFATPDVQTA